MSGTVAFQRCRFTGGIRNHDQKAGGNGLSIGGMSEATVRQCESSGNAWHGIIVLAQARTELEENVCRDNGGCGILYAENAVGTAQRNHCQNNIYYGVGVQGKAQPILKNNVCRGNGRSGILYSSDAGGTARQNLCQGNGESGICVSNQAQPLLEGNICLSNQEFGIVFTDQAGGSARRNNCYGNKRGTIHVSASGYTTPTFEENRSVAPQPESILSYNLEQQPREAAFKTILAPLPPERSVFLAVFLGFFLGPFGMFYSTTIGATTMLAVGAAVGVLVVVFWQELLASVVLSLGIVCYIYPFVVFMYVVACAAWSGLAAAAYNNEARAYYASLQ